ncbi:sigma 54-interacting transcriptional regulator [Chitinimonas lacunae]|uniref:Sigma 54-interacting transcriptional regulator n=1 Tax=Chitinimonas lacunae TaxID=1963018 RepID=A0ABV8MIV0_9NEIS
MPAMPLPQLAVVATRALADLVRELAPLHGGRFELRLIEKPVEQALETVRELARAGLVDAVVAAGRGAERLRVESPVPVAAIQVSGYDILQALARARAIDPRAVLLSRRRLADEFDRLRPLLAIDVVQLLYEDDDEARSQLDRLRQGARPVVVGSSQVVNLAGQFGLPSVLVYSAEAVAQAFEAALELVRVARQEEAKRERLDRILESLAEGVAAVDLEERVQAINPALARLIGVAPEWALGRRLSELAPVLTLQEVLKSGEPRRDEVASVGGRTLVTQRLPLIEAGSQVGAVLTLQESGAIERADRKLRSEARKSQFRARYRLTDLLGESPAIRHARELARLYAQSDGSVLIGGASGTGKELVAQGIHQASRRAGGAFVALNCAALPETLLESELFGYEEGAFTGSRRGGKPGLLELAHQGTLFLDEIGDMPLGLQTRLLRVLQEREVLRLGASEPVPINVRVIAATHADLRAGITAGWFRADLYYRLAILTLTLPPLAERGGDVAILTDALAREALARVGSSRPAHDLAKPLLAAAAGYAWPGNVRELQNLVERAAVLLQAGAALDRDDWRRLAPELGATPLPLDGGRRALALEMLAACGGDRAEAARRLGISRTTLWRLTRTE